MRDGLSSPGILNGPSPSVILNDRRSEGSRFSKFFVGAGFIPARTQPDIVTHLEKIESLIPKLGRGLTLPYETELVAGRNKHEGPKSK